MSFKMCPLSELGGHASIKPTSACKDESCRFNEEGRCMITAGYMMTEEIWKFVFSTKNPKPLFPKS